jgi:CHAT domain-containing protein
MLRKLFVSLIFGFALFAVILGQDAADSARMMFLESRQAIDAGDFQRSKVLLEKLIHGNYGLNPNNLSMIHNNLGFVYYETGRLKESLEQYRQAEFQASRAGEDSLQLRISIYINLILYHKERGDYTNSLEYSMEAFRLLNQVPVWDDYSYNKLSILLLNKGITLYHLGRDEEALEALKESEQVKEQHHLSYLGSVYFNLARVCKRLGDLAHAESYFEKSIDWWSTEHDSGYFELANIYLHFGQYLTDRGDYEQGHDYLQKALQNYLQNYGFRHPLTAACYEALARYSLDRDQWGRSLKYLQLALRSMGMDVDETDPFSNPEDHGSGHELTLLKILSTKTRALELASGQKDTEAKIEYLQAAISTNLHAIDLLQRIRNSVYSTESRIYLNSQQRDLFTTGIRLNMAMYRLTGLELYNDESFLMAASGKSGELIYEMSMKESLYLESLPDTMVQNTMALKQELDHLSNLIETAGLALNPDSSRLSRLREQLFQARDSFTKELDRLRQDHPEISYFATGQDDLNLSQIRRNLKRNETLVEYYLAGADTTGQEQLYIFSVTKKRCHIHQSGIGPDFHHHLETIINNLQDFDPYQETPERFYSLKAALFGMYQKIVQPVEKYFKGKNLIVVPDDLLAFIPFDALITHLEHDSILNYAGVPYLLYQYNISYLYNSRLLARQSPRSWTFPEVTAWIPENAGDTEQGFGSLDGAVEEVRDIMEVTKGQSIQRSLNKPQLSEVLQQHSIIHLAMHSLAMESSGSSPYFILDSVSDPSLGNRMHDYEINALNLSAPMVVLSSCETAGGRLHKGEGIMSLSRSFLQAGASSVVHSLWPVEDLKSREIMVGFYKELKKGRTKSGALAAVKKQYISQQPPAYTHPYYWAAFQVTGNNAPLQVKKKAILVMGSVLVVILVLYGLKRRSFFRRA